LDISIWEIIVFYGTSSPKQIDDDHPSRRQKSLGKTMVRLACGVRAVHFKMLSSVVPLAFLKKEIEKFLDFNTMFLL
jgi:hypothetical protein